jgi:hypothetical protein
MSAERARRFANCDIEPEGYAVAVGILIGGGKAALIYLGGREPPVSATPVA